MYSNSGPGWGGVIAFLIVVGIVGWLIIEGILWLCNHMKIIFQ